MIEMVLSRKAAQWTDGRNELTLNFWGSVLFREGESSFADTVDKIAAMFAVRGEKAFSELEGNFALILSDGEKCFLVNSLLGGPISLYYAENGGKTVCSDRLWPLLEALEYVQPCEEEIQETFIRYGFLPGRETLIRGVNKVPVGSYVVLDTEGCVVKAAPLPSRDAVIFSETEAEALYPSLFGRAVQQGITGHDKTAITLSSGFDSNFILWNLRNLIDRQVDAFCIGGKKGRNEISAAEKLAGRYEDVLLHTKLVDSDTLLHFEEIIWRLEGTVYERGIFLQYELAKLVSQLNFQSIMEGDGADQVMRQNFCLSDGKPEGDVWHMRPDAALRHIVLPKNLRMMYSFGVLPRYPYLSYPVMDCLAALKKCNGTTKAFHKQIVSDRIGELSADHLSDSGGTTHYAALLEDSRVYGQKREAWNFIPYDEALDKYGVRGAEDYYDRHFRKLYVRLFYKIFICEREKWINNEKKNHETAFL